jgi:predicted nucleic acid-binding protein
MAGKYYLDTNVILDLADPGRTTGPATIATLERLMEEGTTHFAVNSDTLFTTYFILVSRQKITREEALLALDRLERMCEVVEIGQEEVREAIALCRDPETPYRDYEDTLQYLCARKAGAEGIVTSDRGFVGGEIPIIHPSISE